MEFEPYTPRDNQDTNPRTRVIFDLESESELRSKVRRASLTPRNNVAPLDKDAQRFDGSEDSLILHGLVDGAIIEKLLRVQSQTSPATWGETHGHFETILTHYL